MILPTGTRFPFSGGTASLAPVYKGIFTATGLGEVEFGFENDNSSSDHVKFSGLIVRKIQMNAEGNSEWALVPKFAFEQKFRIKYISVPQ